MFPAAEAVVVQVGWSNVEGIDQAVSSSTQIWQRNGEPLKLKSISRWKNRRIVKKRKKCMAFDMPGFVLLSIERRNGWSDRIAFQIRKAKKVRARIKVRRIEKGYLEKGGSAVVRKMGCYARQYEDSRRQTWMWRSFATEVMLCIGIKISISVYKGYVNHRCWLSGSCSEGGTI